MEHSAQPQADIPIKHIQHTDSLSKLQGTEPKTIAAESIENQSQSLHPPHTSSTTRPTTPTASGPYATLPPSIDVTHASSLPLPPSPTISNSHLSVVSNLQTNGFQDNSSLHGGTRAASMLSRHSSRPGSVQNIGVTASALIHNAEARRIRTNIYRDFISGWFHLSTSSKLLLAYYIGATVVEIVVTVTVGIIERETATKCFYLSIFLGLYLLRAVVICVLLLRRFLYVRPDDLPRDLSGAFGAHYKTMINWASLLLLMFSIAMLTTQSHCAVDSPGFFYLSLVFSLVGCICLALLLLLWFVIFFCLNGLIILLEVFGVGPTVMRWQGATPEMLDAIPVIKYSKPSKEYSSTGQPLQSSLSSTNEKDTSFMTPPSIVVSEDLAACSAGGSSSVAMIIGMENTTMEGRDLAESSTSATEKIAGTAVNQSHTGWDSEYPKEIILDLENLDPESQEKEQEHEYKEENEQYQEQPQQHSSRNDRLSSSCSICLCDYEDMEELRHLPCDHYFHKECVDEWLKLKRTCPLCKCDVQTNRGRKFWSRRGSHGRSSGSDNHGRGTWGRNPFLGSRRAAPVV